MFYFNKQLTKKPAYEFMTLNSYKKKFKEELFFTFNKNLLLLI